MSAILFAFVRRPGTLPLTTTLQAPIEGYCRRIPFFPSDEDYAIPLVRVPPSRAERLLAAHRIAAAVCARNPKMQVRRPEEVMNHYPHHLGDYATGTQGFTMLEHGAYRLLMDAYYATEGALIDEDVYAIARAASPVERKAVEKVLARKFELRDGRYFHARIETEIAAYRARADQARENGKHGGRKPKGEPERNPDGTDPVSGLEPTTEPERKLASSQKPVAKETTTVKAQYSGVGDIPADPDRLAALSGICAANRVDSTLAKAALHLRQWAAEGVTDQQLSDAIVLGRERIGDGVLRVAYLVPIVADLRAGRVERIEPRGKDAIAGAIAAIAAREGNATH